MTRRSRASFAPRNGTGDPWRPTTPASVPIPQTKPLFGAPDPVATRKPGALSVPLIKKTAHLKSRSLIPASEEGPVLPLFDAAVGNPSRAAAKSGKSSQGGLGERPERSRGGVKPGKPRSGAPDSSTGNRGRAAKNPSKAAGTSSRAGKARPTSNSEGKNERAGTPTRARKAGRTAQARLAFSEEAPGAARTPATPSDPTETPEATEPVEGVPGADAPLASPAAAAG